MCEVWVGADRTSLNVHGQAIGPSRAPRSLREFRAAGEGQGGFSSKMSGM
jgi:hypothetical protein